MLKLDAVNMVLSGLGEPAVSDLSEAGGLDVVMALAIIDETGRYLLNKNWHWNQEIRTITPVNGEIILADNVIRADTIGPDKALDVVKRGQKLYDLKTNATNSFTKPIMVETYIKMPFEDMPDVAQYYVTAHATLTCQQRLLGSESLDKFLQVRAKDAWVDLVRDNLLQSDYNVLDGSYSSQRVLRRGEFPRGGTR